MVFIVEGLQNVGKSSLIKALKYKTDRFSFNEYLDEFKLNTYGELNAFQIGKDLGILFGLNFLSKEEIVILDRGPISTMFYSIKEARKLSKEGTLPFFLNEIHKFKNIHYICVNKINDKFKNKRNKKDGFDYLNDNELDKYNFKLLEETLIKSGLKIYHFNNDFSKSIEENAKQLEILIEDIINEHK